MGTVIDIFRKADQQKGLEGTTYKQSTGIINLTSSFLKSMDYDRDSKTLTIFFKNGKKYIYDSVTVGTADGLSDAGSAGKYYTDKIKEKVTSKIKTPVDIVTEKIAGDPTGEKDTDPVSVALTAGGLVRPEARIAGRVYTGLKVVEKLGKKVSDIKLPPIEKEEKVSKVPTLPGQLPTEAQIKPVKIEKPEATIDRKTISEKAETFKKVATTALHVTYIAMTLATLRNPVMKAAKTTYKIAKFAKKAAVTMKRAKIGRGTTDTFLGL